MTDNGICQVPDRLVDTPLPGASLPAGWRWVRLGEVCNIVRGVSFDLTDVQRFPSEGYIPILRAGNIGDALDVSNDLIFVPGKYISGEQKLRLGDIVICMSSGSASVVGKTAPITNQWDGSVGAFCGIIRATGRMSASFLAYWLRSMDFIKWRDSQARGVNIQNLRISQLAEIDLPCPPISEQQRIDAILKEQMAAVERARTAVQGQIKEAQSLHSSYLDRVYLHAEQELPSGWRWVEIGEICERIDYGFTASADIRIREPRFLRITDIQDGNVNWETVPGCHISPSEENAKKLYHGDILFARTGGTTGKSYLVLDPPERAVFASYLIRLSVGSGVDSRFLFAFFQSDEYWRQIRTAARGGAQPNVNATLLSKIYLALPTIIEQRTIISHLDAVAASREKLLSGINSQLSELDALPAALLRKAFSGEL